MNTTYLSLHFFDSPDPNIFFLQDVSVYNPDMDPSNTYITVLPPNFSQEYTFEYPAHSLIPVNSNLFKWTDVDSYNSLMQLPDGLYVVKQFANLSASRTYNYFRITQLKTKLLELVSDQFNINVGNCFDCSKDESWYKDIFQHLQWLEVAKFMAEQECKIEEAKVIYNQVERFFSKKLC